MYMCIFTHIWMFVYTYILKMYIYTYQALAEEQQVAEEVDRIKRLLVAERQERERRYS